MPMLLLLLSKVICLVSKAEARSLFPGDYKQVPRQREVGLLDECAREILRCAQDDKPLCMDYDHHDLFLHLTS